MINRKDQNSNTNLEKDYFMKNLLSSNEIHLKILERLDNPVLVTSPQTKRKALSTANSTDSVELEQLSKKEAIDIDCSGKAFTNSLRSELKKHFVGNEAGKTLGYYTSNFPKKIQEIKSLLSHAF